MVNVEGRNADLKLNAKKTKLCANKKTEALKIRANNVELE